MEKITRDGLKAMRQAKQAELKSLAEDPRRVVMMFGTGTCGRAAGAMDALKAAQDELKKAGVTDVVVKHTGCMGLCFSEPTVEVRVPGMPAVIYGKVNADVARKIVRSHIVGKQLVSDYIYDKPAGDVIAEHAEAG